MIKALVVDDEKRGIDNIKSLLARYCADVHVYAEAQSIVDAESIIRKQKPDIIFLDVEMPGGNGFELLENIKDLKVNVVFVTAFDSYAIEAFKANAIHYLLKPIDPELLIDSVNQLKRFLVDKSTNLDEVLSSLAEIKKVERIKVPTINGFELVAIADVEYIQSNGSYSQLYLKNGSKIVLSKNIGYLEEILSDEIFFRVHREYIINIQAVQKYTKGRGGDVLLRQGTSIPVAVRRKKSLIRLLGID